MSVWEHDLARDQLNRSWDAAISAIPSDLPQSNPAELALLRRFHALDTAPEPDAAFVERLGQQLTVGNQGQAHIPHTSAVSPPLTGRPSQWSRPARGSRLQRWADLAAALVLVFGGALVLWLAQRDVDPEERSIPAVVFGEPPATPAADAGDAPLLHATFDPASIGATEQEQWTVALEYQLRLESGEAYRQNGPESGDNGVSVVVIDRGTFDALSSGPTLYIRKGESAGQEITSNTSITLAEGDAWITSMSDLATAINTSDGPARLVRAAIGEPGDGTNFEFSPPDGYPFAHDPSLPELPSGPVTVDIQQVSLDPGDTHAIEIRADEPYLLVTNGNGTVRITKDGSNRGASTTATSLGDYPPSAYTISRDLAGTVDVYLARWTSAAASGSATAVIAGAPAFETLLNATVDPQAIAAGPASAWGYSGVFPKQGLHPGQSIVLDAANWGAGLTVTQVLAGELTLESDGPVQIVRAGSSTQEIVPAGSSITLATGDAVMLDASHGAELHNDSDADVSLYTFAAFDLPDQFFPDVPFPENLWGPLTPAIDPDLTQQFDGPVTVSFQRATLDQNQSISVEVGENELVFFDTDDGSSVHFQQAGSSQAIPGGRIVLHDKGPGTYTLTRLADEPVEITIVRMRAAEASPQSAVQREQLANLTFDPALLGADATQSWTMIDEFLVDLGAGETLEIGGENFVGGFFVAFPLSGSVEISTSRDAFWSGGLGAELQPVAAGASQAISSGQLWVGASMSPVEIANHTDTSTPIFVHCLCSSLSRIRGGTSIGPDNLTIVRNEDPDNQFVYEGEPVTVSVERILLDREAQYDFDLGASETVLLMTGDRSLMRVTGDQDQVGASSNQRVLHGTDEPQTYSIIRDIGGPVDIYLVRVSAPPADETATVTP
jgi:hypothetical protein